jgi:endogenous inhibitor of DNA gyrase (YacG/DUF329 family)
MTKINREEWLTRAVKPLTKMINTKSELELTRPVAVSVGWPGGKSVEKVIGQCWPSISGNGTAHLFISPKLVDPVVVLATLLHELIHAADDCEHGHKGIFARTVKDVGLEGKPTATVAGEALVVELKAIAEKLGEYPHHGVTPSSKIKTQSTRMIKLECPECGYIVRTTQKWIDVALPVCGNTVEHEDEDELVELREVA